MRTVTAIILVALLLPAVALAKRDHKEKDYQAQWCTEHKGRQEVVLPDRTRADCVTANHAIEFDFGDK